MFNLKQRGIYSEYLIKRTQKDNETDGKENDYTLKGPNNSVFMNQKPRESKNQNFSTNIESLLDYSNDFLQESIQERKKKEKKNENTQDFINIEPKVMEPFQPIPGRVPRKVEIERKRKNYMSIDIKSIMKNIGIADYLLKGKKDRNLNWMKLEYFDDTTFDDYSEEEWFEKAKKTVCLKLKKEKEQKNIIRSRNSKTEEVAESSDDDDDEVEEKKSFENLKNNIPLNRLRKNSKKVIILSKLKNDNYQKYFPEYENSLSCGKCEQCLNPRIPVNTIWLRNGKFDIKRAILTDYDKFRKEWKGFWEENFMTDRFQRMMFCFYAEDPMKWIQRIKKAVYIREKKNIKLKYQYLIEKMRKDDLNELDYEQNQKIQKRSLNLKKIEKMDIEKIMEEVKIDYKRAMNFIIFEKKILNLKVPFDIKDIIDYKEQKKSKKSKEVLENLKNLKKGFIEIDNKRDKYILKKKDQNFQYLNFHVFNDMFKEFCFSSLFIKKESIQALQQIRLTCKNLDKMSFFSLSSDKEPVKRLDEFKTIQESSISNMMTYLKNTWIDDMITIIKRQFAEIGKGWFNMKETNKLTYEFGKLKRFLTVVRLIMQDTLRQLLKRSLDEFVEFFRKNIPVNVNIFNDYKVVNKFQDGVYRNPVLSLDMIQVANQNEFNFLFKPEKIKSDILSLIKKVVEDLQKIPDLEPKVLDRLHKAKKNDSFVLTPILPKEKPKKPNPFIIPRRYPDENLWLWDLFNDFSKYLDKPLALLEEYKNHFAKHEKLLCIKPEDILMIFEGSKGKDMEFIQNEINKWQKEEEKLKTKISETIHVSCFSINCKEAIRILLGKYQEINKKLIEMLVRRLKENSNSIQKQLNELEKDIYKEPKDIEELAETQNFVENELPNILEKIKISNNEMGNIYDLLESQNYRLPKDQLGKRWALIKGPKMIMELVNSKEKSWERLLSKYEENLHQKKDDFKDSINNIEMIIKNFHMNNKITEHEEMKDNVINFWNKLTDMINKSKKYNHHETLFGFEKTNYSKLSELTKEFKPFLNVWKVVNTWMKNFPLWMSLTWENVDSKRAEVFIEEDFKQFNQNYKNIKIKASKSEDKKSFEKLEEMLEVTKKEILEFKTKVPLLIGLKKEGMIDRHWKEIKKKTGIDIKIDEKMTFEYLLSLGLEKHTDICIEIGEKASREKSIEKSLENMRNEWEIINFELQKFKETGSYIIISFEAIENFLDQHLSETQSLLVNPFKKPYLKEIEEWFDNMVLVSNVIEEWKRFQTQWCYLQPIFDSPDINKQLPNESAMFKRVDTNWRQSISQTKVQKNVLRICTTEGYYEKFKEANENFDKIQKELKSYLEVKRTKFGRFYFLSNDGLLSILSQTKEVEKVQDHLRKVFENIAKLEFDEEKKIQAMFSVENEKVEFSQEVDPNMKQVEDWMGDVERAMMLSVKEKLLFSIKDYKTQNRNEWILKHPGQCVLNGSQVHWTSETEESITNNTIIEYYEKLQDQLKELVLIDRTGLSKNQFITIEALIVIDVHASDVIKKLIDSEVDNIFAFEWISQLRYYIENEDCFVKCLQTKFPYGYEYLGNSNRLVITPLTDKCYMTLMGALRLNLGGAPAGPAGTGKTETTKDLAKALAKQCVVFNCQESMDYKFVGKFFKGLASSGAWCCFDEFNRINVEVLSVIAQQLQELFRAKARNCQSLLFEGSEIKMRPTFSVFITMNPGYAGRTELPDNLKALFRPVAMMVPNYALIAEIKLYSFGFINARKLAKKMVVTFTLSSEQLSSQAHYDYGMRAVMSVINAAGFLKRIDKDNLDEEIILLKALQDVNVPKFLNDDLPLFQNIIKDLFPTTKQPENNRKLLYDEIIKSCDKFNLKPVDSFVSKIYQLNDTMQVRHGLMLVGPTGGGKTSLTKVLKRSLTSLSKSDKSYSKINIERINPKAITMAQLYGQYKEMNWQEGIVELVFEKAIKNQFDSIKGKEKYWILFDGPVDALWIESMNTVLDDNKKLCLSSGKVLIVSDFMSMLFEVEDLKEASPATVSRCGMVYVESESMDLTIFLDSFLNKIKDIHENNTNFISIFNKYTKLFVLETIEFVRTNCNEIVYSVDNNLVESFCKLFECIIKENEKVFKNKEDEEFSLEDRLSNLILYCAVWSICCTVNYSGRNKIENYLKKKIQNNKDLDKIIIKKDFYNLRYNVNRNIFDEWVDKDDKIEISPTLKFNEIIIPTVDSTRMIYFTQLLIKNKYNVLNPGETGTGKSTNALYLMTNKLSEEYISTSIVLSAQTTAEQILETVLNQIGKRQRGILGPASGKKLLLFIDDLNMPKKEVYGAQPPIELLRQYLDHSAWYIWKSNKEYLKIEDLVILGSMGPPIGGRSHLSSRFMRHFNILTYTELEDSVVKYIFGNIINNFLKKFQKDVKDNISEVINQTLLLYNKIKKDLLPVPSKSHYQFNLRDLSKVFAGISSASSKHVQNKIDFARLWCHETSRVFHDRLINSEDREYFQHQLNCHLEKMDLKNFDIYQYQKDLIFTDFHSSELEKEYCHVKDIKGFVNRLEDLQGDYNSDLTKGNSRLNLVLFLDACQHISRICRILSQPQGHALLLGVGGSGKQSLSKLSAFISEKTLFTIEITKNYTIQKWRDDLKKMIFSAIVDNKEICFLFPDTQIFSEEMLEDINCLLNTGTIVNLTYNDEEEKMTNDVAKSDCIKKDLVPNKINLFQQKISRVKKNTHVVLTMSPLGQAFWNRLRMFPALINCCTINWFLEWPEEALVGVANGDLIEFEDKYTFINPKEKFVDFFKYSHKHVEEQSILFKRELKRYNYITPTSYLELLKSFKMVLLKKSEENKKSIERLTNGMTRLKEANENVGKLKQELKEEEPELRKTEEEVNEMLKKIAKDKKIADEKKEIVAQEEKEAKIAQEEAMVIANKVKTEVEEADKELSKTLEKISLLNQSHMSKLKSYKNPGDKIKYVFMATCILMLDPTLINIKKSFSEQEQEDYFWGLARKHLLSDINFLSKLKAIDFKAVEEKTIKKIKELVVNHPKRSSSWDDKDMKITSIPNYCLFLLVNSVIKFDELFKKTQPLRKQKEKVLQQLKKKTRIFG